jgi:hypothetical protein
MDKQNKTTQDRNTAKKAARKRLYFHNKKINSASVETTPENNTNSNKIRRNDSTRQASNGELHSSVR